MQKVSRIISAILDWFSDFFAYRKGLLIILGIFLIVCNFVLQFFVGLDFFVESNFFLHLGVLIALVGVLLTRAL